MDTKKETVLFYSELENFFPYFAKYPKSKARIVTLGLRTGTIRTVPYEDYTDTSKEIDLEELCFSRKSIIDDFDFTIVRRQKRFVDKANAIADAVATGKYEDEGEALECLAKVKKAFYQLELYKLTYRYLEEIKHVQETKINLVHESNDVSVDPVGLSKKEIKERRFKLAEMFAEDANVNSRMGKEQIARQLLIKFPELTYPEVGKLLPATPGTTVSYEGNKAQGQRLLGKK